MRATDKLKMKKLSLVCSCLSMVENHLVRIIAAEIKRLKTITVQLINYHVAFI
jgi:hypothetical protein